MAFDPALTLADLTDAADTNADDIVSTIVTDLAAGTPPFPVTDWEDGGVFLTLLEADAAQIANANGVILNIAKGGFISLADATPPANGSPTATWLDLCGDQVYDEQRIPAITGQYNASVTVAAGRGPYTIQPNGLWISDPTGARRYNSTNTSPVVISAAGPTTLVFAAESPGAIYNTSASTIGTVMPLVTVLLGVTVTMAAAPGSGPTAAITAGQDLEAAEAFRNRCRTKWATLSVVATRDAMINYATSVVSSNGKVTGVLVDDTNPDGPGTFRVYIATATGVASGGLVTDVDTALQLKKPETSSLTTLSASALAVTLAGTVHVPASFLAAAKVAADAAFAEFQQALQIGDGAGAGAVYVSKLVEMVMDANSPNGPRDATFTTPAADVIPAKGQICVLGVPSTSLTWIGV